MSGAVSIISDFRRIHAEFEKKCFTSNGECCIVSEYEPLEQGYLNARNSAALPR